MFTKDIPIVEVLVSRNCPHADAAMELALRTTTRLAPEVPVQRIEITSAEEAEAMGFLGSPSFRINGRDIEGETNVTGSLSCRMYRHWHPHEGHDHLWHQESAWREEPLHDIHGVPPEWLLEAALLRALGMRGILFLCVANSARSQIAEGIAKSLAPSSIKIFSAGSNPTSVRPEVLTVLQEWGIEPGELRSKSVTEIPPGEVDTVVTLCAEEECPLFLGKAKRLHWGLPDPARVEDTEHRLAAFRWVRDELGFRLRYMFGTSKEEYGE